MLRPSRSALRRCEGDDSLKLPNPDWLSAKKAALAVVIMTLGVLSSLASTGNLDLGNVMGLGSNKPYCPGNSCHPATTTAPTTTTVPTTTSVPTTTTVPTT